MINSVRDGSTTTAAITEMRCEIQLDASSSLTFNGKIWTSYMIRSLPKGAELEFDRAVWGGCLATGDAQDALPQH